MLIGLDVWVDMEDGDESVVYWKWYELIDGLMFGDEWKWIYFVVE